MVGTPTDVSACWHFRRRGSSTEGMKDPNSTSSAALKLRTCEENSLAKGAQCRESTLPSVSGEKHSLDIAFYRTQPGTGISLVLGNAGSQTQRNGTFDGILFDVGLGFANLSGSYFRDDNGTWQVAISPFGAGVGLSVTTLTTNTVAFAAYPKSVKTCPGGKH